MYFGLEGFSELVFRIPVFVFKTAGHRFYHHQQEIEKYFVNLIILSQFSFLLKYTIQ